MRLRHDHRYFVLTEDAAYRWYHDAGNYDALEVIVPEAFIHDFASVPRPLWWFISPFDLGLASIFHDWLYRNGGHVETRARRSSDGVWQSVTTPWTRRDADRLFARIMREQGVPKLRRRAAFQAVQWFGGKAWQPR
ncbi:MAG: DUF1353 domain-containing protein [Longimicrobiales bacterium]|nr:DUF1353 domain-containing protein [Longimicrobiales bacterium]